MTIVDAKKFSSSEGNVWKYVFHLPGAVTESVLYRYESFGNRTVLCCSVQSGCPVGCTFCGTGKRFIRNLSHEEIVEQVDHVLKDNAIDTAAVKKLQIMFMSMGEPFLNYDSVEVAIRILHKKYPNAQLLVSTIAPDNDNALKRFIELSEEIPQIGLQFSIHKSSDVERNNLIPFRNKLSLKEIAYYGYKWFLATGRKPYCNYCIDGKNNTEKDFQNLNGLFDPKIFCFTFSVICAKDETMKAAAFRDINVLNDFRNNFVNKGYDTRIFDPAGQDDIGGGCGQLWYVQRYLENKNLAV